MNEDETIMTDGPWTVAQAAEKQAPEWATDAGGWPIKEHWGPGPWQDEPDRFEWRAHGLACLIVRGPHGALCGYTGVPRKHPFFGRDYGSIEDLVHVHGGLTFSGGCSGKICHSAPEIVHWFGFDCAHFGDFSPALEATTREIAKAMPGMKIDNRFAGTYRTLAYVREETEELASQLARWRGGKARRLAARQEARIRRKRRKNLVMIAGDASRFNPNSWIARSCRFVARVDARHGIRIPRSLRG